MRPTWISRLQRFFIPNSLRFQLLSRSLFILAGLLMLIGVFQYYLMSEFIYRNKAESIQTEILNIPHNAWQQSGQFGPLEQDRGQGPGQGQGQGPDRRPLLFQSNSSVVFIDLKGQYSVLSNLDDVVQPPKLAAQEYLSILQNNPTFDYRIIRDETSGFKQLVVMQPIKDRNRIIGVAQVSTTTNELDQVLMRQLLIFIALSVTALILGLLAFLPVLKKTLVPLSNLADTVEQINAGNLAERFPTYQGQLEIDRLSVSFNGMLERLELSFEAEKEAKEQMHRFIADASHELRTPLTSIHGFLEVLLRGAAGQPDQLERALNSMYGESERINKLVQDLLLIVKLDRTPNIQLEEGCLDTVVREMEPQLRILAGTRKVSFHISSDLKCFYDPNKMKQVILNLYYNAVQHTDAKSGHIEITLAPKEYGVQLSIRDNGPGIIDKHLPYLFDRFYRSDSSRTRKSGGSGLGLSITKTIVDIHGGTIHVESVEGQGSTFSVWLPLRAG